MQCSKCQHEFVDVKGSMELAEKLDCFEGTVNQYAGDGIMALFGAPTAHKDHAQRACYAGLVAKELGG